MYLPISRKIATILKMNDENPAIPEKFLKPYDPQATEAVIYQRWEESGYFNPDTCIAKGIADPEKEHFSIVLPPPNVTGTLHMGHASMLAIEDILVRYNRMIGKPTLWIPGTDHAAIATQEKVEKELYKKEKKTRHDLGRTEFLKRVEEFAKDSHDTIVGQVRAMGSSIDWSREAYTLDEARSLAVNTAFKRMFDAGLIYRGHRIVNWDSALQTTVSDDEVEYVEQTDKFYYLKYGPFTIGTARPETKFGDKYVVMHPDDERYKEYEHRQQIELEWINGPITATIIKDEAADPEMGTGVMTITPAHSAIDFEIAERHELDVEQVIDERGLLLPIAGEFEGQHIKKAREVIVEKLQRKGLVEKIDENYLHSVATNSRGGGIIEPQVKLQWFIDVNKEFSLPHCTIPGIQPGQSTTLKKTMRHAVEGGAIRLMPERFTKTYYHWIDNLRPWCISRQIWYGHRIPVWYRGEEIHVDVEPPEGDGWEQDPDTLDTWFSSGLWTFSTLGWPNEEAPDLQRYHPTTVLETGYDILFFWVARMILMTSFLLGTVPFRYVYLHGLVRDEQNRKMSKSLGNIIDPMDMIKKYGADATRLSLVMSAAPGNDMPISEDRVRGYKHFANKIWNISRFVLENTSDAGEDADISDADAALLDEARSIARFVAQSIGEFRLDRAGDTAYHFVWDRFAAEILEESKPILSGDDASARMSRRRMLYEILSISLKILHPFMPFVTEAVWQELPRKDVEILMVAKWPGEDAD